MRKLILCISALAGGGDFLTGLLLLVAPGFALRMMGVPPVPELVWIQFIGVFVGAVGLSYIVGLLSWRKSGSLAKLLTVWQLTVLIRVAVGTFVAIKILSGTLSPAWASVPSTDFFWAFVQLALMRHRLWDHA